MRTFTISLITLGLAAACGSNSSNPDAKTVDAKADAAVDAAIPHLGFSNNEGGEIRLEWIQNQANAVTTRATAFFYKSQDPANHALPSFPGCFDTRVTPQQWPFAQGTIVPLDVGDVIISTGTGPDLDLVRDDPVAAGGTVPTTCADRSGFISAANAACVGGTAPANTHCTAATQATACPGGGLCTGIYSGGCDFFGRPHGLSWKKLPVSNDPTDGPKLPADALYDITFTGSSQWPAQSFNKIPFMPANWTPADPVNTATLSLVAGTPAVLTLMPDASQNLPPSTTDPEDPYQVNTAVAFTVAGITEPVVICQQDFTSATVTIPAALVDTLRGLGTSGTFVRQHLTHRFIELTDGTPVAPADRKRIDVLTIWCYNSPWTAP